MDVPADNLRGHSVSTLLAIVRDPALALLIAVLSFIAVFVVFRWQQRPKELTFGLLSSNRLISVHDAFASRITVQLDGKEVRDLHLRVYGLKNSGLVAIIPEDFQTPITVRFAGGLILSAGIVREKPGNLKASIENRDGAVVIAPLLLNPGDELVYQVLVSAEELKEEVEGRVRDVTSFQKPVMSRADTSIGGLIGMLGMTWVFGGAAASAASKEDWASLIFFAAICSLLVAAFFVPLVRQRWGTSGRRRLMP